MKENCALTDDDAMELLAYLVASARSSVTEPPDYSTLRLLTAAEYLARGWKKRCSDELAVLIDQLITDIPEETSQRWADPQRFVAFLGICSRRIAAVIKWSIEQEADEHAY